jgi:hypothetical protein
MILASAFNKSEGFFIENQYFIDYKPSFYRFENETVNLTSAETAEKWGRFNRPVVSIGCFESKASVKEA